MKSFSQKAKKDSPVSCKIEWVVQNELDARWGSLKLPHKLCNTRLEA